MKVSVEKLPTSEAVLNVDVTWDDLEKASDKAYRKLVKQVDVQGFRRGKAPRTLLERKLGKEYIYQEGLDELISETYRNALKENDIIPISQPKLDAPVFEIGQPYHFSLTVPVITPVVLGDYQSLHFDREEATVTSEEVDKELEALQTRATIWETVERAVEYGDRVKADLKLVADEKTISDLKENTFEITQDDRPGLFAGMDEHFVGMQAGDSKTFSTTIPADYTNDKLAGKQADYEVTVHAVEAKEVPTLDDAFAEKVSDGQYETLEDLSKGLSDNILESKKRRINNELREQILNAVVEQSEFSLHPLLIDEEVEAMEHQFGHMLEQQHLSMDQYLKMMRKSHEEYHAELRPDAEKRVKRELVLEEIARRELIDVQSEELEALFNAYTQMGQELPRTEEQVRSMAINYRREKTLSRLVKLTTDPDPDAESELLAADEADEAAIANAEAAALAAGEVTTDEAQSTPLTGEAAIDGTEAHPSAETAQNETIQPEVFAHANPLPDDQSTETVE